MNNTNHNKFYTNDIFTSALIQDILCLFYFTNCFIKFTKLKILPPSAVILIKKAVTPSITFFIPETSFSNLEKQNL